MSEKLPIKHYDHRRTIQPLAYSIDEVIEATGFYGSIVYGAIKRGDLMVMLPYSRYSSLIGDPSTIRISADDLKVWMEGMRFNNYKYVNEVCRLNGFKEPFDFGDEHDNS